MIPEIGNFALILAFCIALAQGIFPILGAHLGYSRWVALAKPTAYGQFLFMLMSYICLTVIFINHDFSVLYAAKNSNTELPLLYLVSGVWGAHEGSLLLWALILSGWTAAVAVFNRSVPAVMLARVLGVLGFVSVGFILFILLTSNPFDRLFPAVLEGRDLNPLLQDPGLAIHPPMLYLGYVGFSVAFAFAIAALLSGQVDSAWARWSRPWTNFAWLFLTLGIALGSWWAYYELGWGGWWFWDPVENASFMPWLVGTALLHSLAITEKRGTFKAWTALLAIFAFSLSLLGTFLVRSGVLTSVHAFASDPKRGIYILIFLGVVVGASLVLYAWRAPTLKSAAVTNLLSRDMALLLNNIFLTVATAAILLGTVYPIFVDAMGGKLSVGPPYFNLVFLTLTAPIGVLIGVGMIIRWKDDKFKRLMGKLLQPLVISSVLAVLLSLMLPKWHWQALAGLMMAIWIAASVVLALTERLKGRESMTVAITSIPRGFYGMLLGHIGIAFFIVGVTLVSLYNIEKDLRMAPGDSYEMAGYTFKFNGVNMTDIDNYQAARGDFDVTHKSGYKTQLTPEKRVYRVQQNPMTEAAIDAGFTRDLFIALGEEIGHDGSWAIRIYYKPFIRWIWLGALLMSLGGLLAGTDKRYRRIAKKEALQERVA